MTEDNLLQEILPVKNNNGLHPDSQIALPGLKPDKRGKFYDKYRFIGKKNCFQCG